MSRAAAGLPMCKTQRRRTAGRRGTVAFLAILVSLAGASCSSRTDPYELAPVVSFAEEVVPYAVRPGEEELFLSTSTTHITLYDRSKRIVWQGDVAGAPSVCGVGELREGGPKAIFFAIKRGEELLLGVLRDPAGFSGWMGDIPIEYWKVAESAGGINRVMTEDLDADGRFEILVAVYTYEGLYPRGLVVFDSRGEKRWEYLCAPFVSSIEVEDINADGRPEVILGTYGLSNRAVVDGRMDTTGALIVLSCTGEELLYREMGGEWGRAVPKVVSLNSKKVLAVAEQGYLGSNTDPDSLLIIAGPELAEKRIIQTGEHFLGMDVIDTDHDGSEEIVTGNTDGVIRVLDGDLNEKASLQMPGSVEVLETVDLDGDGRKEIVAYAESGRLIVLNEKLERLAALDMVLPNPDKRFRENHVISVAQRKGKLLLIRHRRLSKLMRRSPLAGGPMLVWMWVLAGLLTAGLLSGLGLVVARSSSRRAGGVYEEMAQAAGSGFVRLDQGGRIRFINTGALRMLGMEPNDVVGKTYTELALPDPLRRLMADAMAGLSPDETVFVLDSGRTVNASFRRRSGQLLVILEDVSHPEAAIARRMGENKDALTGFYRREVLDTEIAGLLRDAALAGVPLSLLMVDIDHFKRINDTYGHPQGDAVLRELGGLVLNISRGKAIPIRYGGEELVLILPNYSTQEAQVFAERLRTAVAGCRFIEGLPDLKVTVSIGVSSYPSLAKDAQQLIKTADQAVYRAKKAGRNRVETAGSAAS